MKKNQAVFTMVYNESVFLPLWLKYYSQFFAPEDIYVLDHGSTDGSTGGTTAYNCIPVPGEVIDAEMQRNIVQQKQHELISEYEIVLYTDVDEMVVPSPERGDLGKYLEFFRCEAIQYEYTNCNGFELLHMKESEPPLDVTRPIMPQRSHWFPNDDFLSKPLLARIPMEWDLGCHSTPKGKRQDFDLYLIHLHRVDYDLCLARHNSINQRPRCHQDMKNGWSDQRHIVDPVAFHAWFYGNYAQNQRPIPEEWKQVKL